MKCAKGAGSISNSMALLANLNISSLEITGLVYAEM